MSEWAPKRFWTKAEVVETGDGFAVQLDGRPVRTPSKQVLAMPSRGLAELVAQEWQAQQERIDPTTMPATRGANTALDRVAPQQAEVATLIAAYAETDLLCYRATAPEALVALQAEAWDPLLDWAAQTYGARLAVTSGVMPIAQDRDALARLAGPVHAMTPFALTGFHDLVSLSGSLVLGLAAAQATRSPDEFWALAKTWDPEKYDPDKWMKAAKAAGFQYAVLTAKPHLGYAIWPSQFGDMNTRVHMNGRD
ncbi:hypothetical protein LCGC14_2180350, partial [marine sediment metagenome]